MEVIIAIILYNALVSAGFCYFIASQKGRATEIWGTLGFLFGILALLAIVGLPKIDTQTDLYKKCPNCLENIRYRALICRYCHSELSTSNNAKNSENSDSAIQQNDSDEKTGGYKLGIGLELNYYTYDTDHIISTLSGSAAKSGLEEGDKILRIDEIDVQNISHEKMVEKLASYQQGQEVIILIERHEGMFAGYKSQPFLVIADVEDR
tara:strand:- start:157 stop:780 length:624 start_codon:yes stop_codon:yes gene_type:complete